MIVITFMVFQIRDVNETLEYETEAFPLFHETEMLDFLSQTRPRCYENRSHFKYLHSGCAYTAKFYQGQRLPHFHRKGFIKLHNMCLNYCKL